MADIGKLLKDEISRLARKEMKNSFDSLRKDFIVMKRTLADHKKQLAKLERENKRLLKTAETQCQTATQVDEDEVDRARVTAKMIVALRSRLGLSREKFATLVGVSAPSVYLWETKKGRLSFRGDKIKAQIVAVKKLTKKEAQEKLATLLAAKKSARKK